jgi:hypothetical protein
MDVSGLAMVEERDGERREMDHNKFTTGLDKRTNKFCETEN